MINQKRLLGRLRGKEDVERDGKGRVKRSKEAKVVGPEAGESFQNLFNEVAMGVKDSNTIAHPNERNGDVEKDSGFTCPRLTDDVEVAGELGR